jgi:hypothetical protein
MKISNGCQTTGTNVNECMRKNNAYFYQYPRSNDKVSIYNPKQVVGDNYPKAAEMLNRFKTMQAAGPYDDYVFRYHY